MAEFCLECFNKINDMNVNESQYILSDELDLCEGCGQWKRVVVAKRENRWEVLEMFFWPLALIFIILKLLWKLIKMFYRSCKRKKN